ncbi:hypothetical protein BB559_002180 [Furculomyces boomerangus]|uniref:Ankyrin repeat protein n=2 Tax=Harpellales TaxID=61421 RepID=A0A2T9YXD4_9FUNG|nr:hypothetical protein BB559_002180 [Furculomyces boomerangus]PWA02045.1 hypothetical protein BB558_001826 [Smittium angustum]
MKCNDANVAKLVTKYVKEKKDACVCQFNKKCKGNYEIVEFLLDYDERICSDLVGYLRDTFDRKFIKIIELLVEYGADIDTNNHHKLNPFMSKESIAKNEPKTVNIMLDLGAYVDPNNEIAIRTVYRFGVGIRAQKDKELVLACKNSHYNIAKLAIEYGATFNSSINEILTDSYLAGHKRIIDLLIEYGADQSIIPSCDFLLACKRGDFDKVKNLVECGKVDIQLKENLGSVWSCSLESTDIAECLLKRDANIHARKERALITACRNGRYHTLELLIKNGAKLTARNNRPLVCAVERTHIDIVNLLTDNNVSFYEKNGYPIH